MFQKTESALRFLRQEEMTSYPASDVHELVLCLSKVWHREVLLAIYRILEIPRLLSWFQPAADGTEML